MDPNRLIDLALDSLAPGQKFHVRRVYENEPIGSVIECRMIQRLPVEHPTVLAHVGPSEDVHCLGASTDHIDGATVVTLIGFCGSDAETDHEYPAAMLSDEWAGTLFVVLD